MKKKDILIISKLRSNSRETLTNLSRATKIPVSTIYDRMKNHYGDIIRKHTVLLDFNKLGFNTRAHILIKVKKEDKELFKEALIKNSNINSIFKINNGYDYLIEAVFRNIQEIENFMEAIESKFKVLNRQVFYIIDELKREDFLINPELLNL